MNQIITGSAIMNPLYKIHEYDNFRQVVKGDSLKSQTGMNQL